MGFSLEPCWIVLWKLGDEVHYEYFKTQGEFELHLRWLKKLSESRDVSEVCCLVPNNAYVPFYVEELE